jgi:hypothetical protein
VWIALNQNAVCAVLDDVLLEPQSSLLTKHVSGQCPEQQSIFCACGVASDTRAVLCTGATAAVLLAVVCCGL